MRSTTLKEKEKKIEANWVMILQKTGYSPTAQAKNDNPDKTGSEEGRRERSKGAHKTLHRTGRESWNAAPGFGKKKFKGRNHGPT